MGERTDPKPCALNLDRIKLDLNKQDQTYANPGRMEAVTTVYIFSNLCTI